ncbi:hypothetical protein KKH36_03925 [Patescibacteria group bacterium]|nr:hypothetical protein [Patescibacteria group bacterium]
MKKNIKNIEKLRNSLQSQLGILKSLNEEGLEGRLKEVYIVAASLCSTGSAICELGKNPNYFFAEMIMLGRSFIEKTTNFCYLLVCDKEEYKNFLLHPYYRMYHNFERQKNAGEVTIGLKYTGKNEFRGDPKITEALSQFSENNPRKNWSKKNIDEKVALIQEKSEIRVEFFLLNTLSIYSNASEALHGSLYGCTFHIGVFEPGTNHKDLKSVEEKVLKETALLFAQLSSMVAETLKLVSTLHEMNEKLKKSKEYENKTLEEMKKLFE